jgi:hypothetical protein
VPAAADEFNAKTAKNTKLAKLELFGLRPIPQPAVTMREAHQFCFVIFASLAGFALNH